MPATDSIENAVVVKGYSRKQFADLAAFQQYVIGDWAFGQHPDWSAVHVCYGKKELGQFKDFGRLFIVYYFLYGKLYYCKYALLETKSAFLWVEA